MRMTPNVNRVMAAAPEIVRRLRETGVTVGALMDELQCSYATLMRAILSQITKAQYKALARKRIGRGGIEHRFKRGHETWNKGKKGWCAPGSRATQFKPGQIRGAAARKYKPIGSITIHQGKLKSNYKNARRNPPSRWIKVDEGKYIPYARYIWEQAHGPVPPGYFVGHRDNNTMNDNLGNLFLIDRKGHMRRLYDRPDVIARCRARASAVTKRRHARNRAAKKWAKGQKQQARMIYECLECGAEFQQHVSRCTKCLSGVVVRSKIVPMPESMIREGMEHAEAQELEAAYA